MECFLDKYKIYAVQIFFYKNFSIGHNFLILLSNNKILDWSKLKALADDKINVSEKLKFCVGKGRKHCGKRRKCWLPAFSPFPTMFLKSFFFKVVKSRDLVVKELNVIDRAYMFSCVFLVDRPFTWYQGEDHLPRTRSHLS